MPKLSRYVRSEFRTLLSAAWSTTVLARAVDYPEIAPADVTALASIDWPAVGPARQVVEGQIDIGDLERTSSMVYPTVVYYARSLRGTDAERYRYMSGDVAITAEFEWSWPQSRALPSFEGIHDLLEDVVVTILHDPAWLGNMSPGMSYRGDLTYDRGPVTTDGRNWRQAGVLQIVFGLEV